MPLPLALTITSDDVPRPVPVALLSGALDEKLAVAAALGYEGVELMVLEPRQMNVARLTARLDALGLRCAAVASGAQAGQAGLTLLSPDPAIALAASERLEALIDLAAALESPAVTVGSFRGRAAGCGTLEEAADALMAALESAALYAAPRGVRLALEPLNRYESDLLHTAAEALAFCEQIGCANVGVLFDTFHANIEEVTFEGALHDALRAGRLFHVHLGDSNRQAPGRGHIPFGPIVQTLIDGQYDGWLSAELFPLPTPNAAAAETLRTLRPLLAGAAQPTKESMA